MGKQAGCSSAERPWLHVCAVHTQCDTKLKPWRLYIQYGEVPCWGPVFSFYWTFMGYLRGCLLFFMFESLISNLMQSDTVVIDFWMIQCTSLYIISKQGWLAGLWFFRERSCLPLSLPLTTLSSVSLPKFSIYVFPAYCEFVYVCICSEDVQFECFSSSALSGWRTAVFCRWGLWIGIFSIPAPTHSPTHANTGTNLTLLLWAD